MGPSLSLARPSPSPCPFLSPWLDRGCAAQTAAAEHPYVTAVYAASKYVVERLERPQYLLDVVYYRTAHGRRTVTTIKTLHGPRAR